MGKNLHKTILSLCDYSGNWSQPYVDAGYNVIRLDIKTGNDIRTYEFPGEVYGILAAPPCDHLALSGARWWESKGESALLEALALADCCMRYVGLCKPKFWALENPVGRLSKYYGKPTFTFNPCDFGDPYTKKTCLWGNFIHPTSLIVGQCMAVEPTEGSKMHKFPPSENRKELRSETPKGFAKAFFIANQ